MPSFWIHFDTSPVKDTFFLYQSLASILTRLGNWGYAPDFFATVIVFESIVFECTHVRLLRSLHMHYCTRISTDPRTNQQGMTRRDSFKLCVQSTLSVTCFELSHEREGNGKETPGWCVVFPLSPFYVREYTRTRLVSVTVVQERAFIPIWAACKKYSDGTVCRSHRFHNCFHQDRVVSRMQRKITFILTRR